MATAGKENTDSHQSTLVHHNFVVIIAVVSANELARHLEKRFCALNRD